MYRIVGAVMSSGALMCSDGMAKDPESPEVKCAR